MLKNSLLKAAIITSVALAVFLVLIYIGLESIDVSSYFQKDDLYKDEIVLFYRDDCPYCSKVDNFIKENKVEDKVKFTRLNVLDNQLNIEILSNKAKVCGLDIQKIGVPFLWNGHEQKCMIGYVDIIDFFKGRITVKKP